MDKNKVMEFVKTHEKKIKVAGAAIGAVGVAAGCAFFGTHRTTSNDWIDCVEDLRRDWNVGLLSQSTCRVVGDNAPEYCAIVHDVTVADLGKLGQEFVRKGVDANSHASVTMYIGERIYNIK